MIQFYILHVSIVKTSYNQVSLLEKQQIRNPQAATIRKLAAALGKQITDFIIEEEA